MEAIMAERERWEGRIRAAENRWEATITITVTVGGNAKLARIRYKALCTTIMGDGERGEGGVHRGGRDLKREQDGLTAKRSLLRNDAAEIASKLARERY